jgi:hypothetical protein
LVNAGIGYAIAVVLPEQMPKLLSNFCGFHKTPVKNRAGLRRGFLPKL